MKNKLNINTESKYPRGEKVQFLDGAYRVMSGVIVSASHSNPDLHVKIKEEKSGIVYGVYPENVIIEID